MLAASVLSVAALTATAPTGVSAGPARPLVYSAYYQPDAFDYAGQVALHLRNPSRRPLTVTRMDLDGESVGRIWPTDETFLEPDVRDAYIEVANDQVAWYRVYPNPIPSRGMAEVVVRLVPKR